MTQHERNQIALQQSKATIKAQLLEIEAIYQTAPIGLAVLDAELRFQRINQQLADMNGLPVEAHLGRSVREVLPELAHEVEPLFHQLLQTGQPLLDLEIKGETPAQPGVTRIWLESWYPIRAENEQIVGINIVCQEITERKQSELALQQSEAFKQRLLESSPDCIKVLDLAGRLTYMNVGGLRLMEVDDLGPHLNTEWVRFWSEDCRAEAEAALALAKQGGTGQFQGQCSTFKGILKWWDVSVTPVLGAAGQVDQLLVVSRDISDRKQTEFAIARSEQQSRQILNSLFSFVGILTPDGTLTEANRTALEAADLQPEDVLGKSFEETYWWSHSTEVQERLRGAIDRAAAGEMVRYDAVIRVKDEQLITIDFTLVPVFDDAGRVKSLI
ncbi:MAG: PAS domain-containing protein, partial [Thermosynechococcaceae cyanobacterium]